MFNIIIIAYSNLFIIQTPTTWILHYLDILILAFLIKSISPCPLTKVQ